MSGLLSGSGALQARGVEVRLAEPLPLPLPSRRFGALAAASGPNCPRRLPRSGLPIAAATGAAVVVRTDVGLAAARAPVRPAAVVVHRRTAAALRRSSPARVPAAVGPRGRRCRSLIAVASPLPRAGPPRARRRARRATALAEALWLVIAVLGLGSSSAASATTGRRPEVAPVTGITAAPPTTAPVTSAVAHSFISAPPPTPTISPTRAVTGSASPRRRAGSAAASG